MKITHHKIEKNDLSDKTNKRKIALYTFLRTLSFGWWDIIK